MPLCNFYSQLNDDQLTICKINVKVRSMDIQRQLIKQKIDLVIKHINNGHFLHICSRSKIWAAEHAVIYNIHCTVHVSKIIFLTRHASSAFDFGTNINFVYFNRRPSQSYTEQSKKFCYFSICLVSLNILDTSYLNTCTKILSL